MSVDDTNDDPAHAVRTTDGDGNADADTDDRTSGDRPSPTALRATEPALTIEFGRETGEIRIRRETALGTYTESVNR